jgi:hypothetical protein
MSWTLEIGHRERERWIDFEKDGDDMEQAKFKV